MWWNCLTMPWQPGLLTWSMTPTRGWRKDTDASNDASIGRSPIPLALPISMPDKSGRGCAALAWLKRPAQWASRCLKNFAVTSRACRGRREPLAQLCVAIGASKMASTGYSTTPFKKMPVACAKITASRTLSSCDIWHSICSNKSKQPNVASKPGGSKLDGVTIPSTKSSPLNI